MEEIIIYFKCKKNSKKISPSRHKFRFRREKLCLERKEKYGLHFIIAEVPFSYEEMQFWKKEKVEKTIKVLTAKIQKEIPAMISDTWYEPQMFESLQYKNRIYPLSFLLGIYKAFPGTEQIMLRGGEEVFHFISEIYSGLNALTIYTDDERRWEEFIEEAYEQSGLIVQCNQYTQKKEDRRTCFFDFGESPFPDYRSIPPHTIYIDFEPSKQKKRVLLAKRKDVTYCTYAKFLDTHVTDRV